MEDYYLNIDLIHLYGLKHKSKYKRDYRNIKKINWFHHLELYLIH